LKNEAVAIIDAIAPPDRILGAPMGSSDGKVKKIKGKIDFKWEIYRCI